LFDCLDHRDKIERWREALPLRRRLELNHPKTVLINWQKTTVAEAENKPARLSPVAKLKQEVVRLEDENHQLRSAGDDLFSARDSAVDIARLIADRLLQRLSPDKVRRIVEELPQIVAERAELTRNAMTATPPARRKKHRRTVEDLQRDLARRRAEIAS
jgi:hypothetical protein